jgi:D-alanine transaminase
MVCSDGIYEVCEVFAGQLVDETRHTDRMKRSLQELGIAMPVNEQALKLILREVVRRNKVTEGMVYWQVTRGVAKRDHVFPSADTPSALVVTAKNVDRVKGNAAAANGIKVITTPDNRWERVDIKAVSLLPNVLARQKAKEQGAKEAWFVDKDGYVTEGAATNAWIISKENTLITRPATIGILRGVTRTTLFDICAKEGITIVERGFSVDEAKSAKEAFISAATTLIMPVVQIDETIIGDGKPGPLATKLRAGFHCYAEIAA